MVEARHIWEPTLSFPSRHAPIWKTNNRHDAQVLGYADAQVLGYADFVGGFLRQIFGWVPYTNACHHGLALGLVLALDPTMDAYVPRLVWLGLDGNTRMMTERLWQERNHESRLAHKDDNTFCFETSCWMLDEKNFQKSKKTLARTEQPKSVG